MRGEGEEQRLIATNTRIGEGKMESGQSRNTLNIRMDERWEKKGEGETMNRITRKQSKANQ